jgi:hypothetical protein
MSLEKIPKNNYSSKFLFMLHNFEKLRGRGLESNVSGLSKYIIKLTLLKII